MPVVIRVFTDVIFFEVLSLSKSTDLAILNDAGPFFYRAGSFSLLDCGHEALPPIGQTV